MDEGFLDNFGTASHVSQRGMRYKNSKYAVHVNSRAVCMLHKWKKEECSLMGKLGCKKNKYF